MKKKILTVSKEWEQANKFNLFFNLLILMFFIYFWGGAFVLAVLTFFVRLCGENNKTSRWCGIIKRHGMKDFTLSLLGFRDFFYKNGGFAVFSIFTVSSILR